MFGVSVGTVVSTDTGPWATTTGNLVPIDVERSSVGEPIRVFDEDSLLVPAANGNELWVGRILPGEITRFDVERREFTGSVPLPANRVVAVPVVGDGAVYVAWNQLASPLTVARFDSKTLQQTAAVDIPTGAAGLTFHRGALWATDPLRGVVMKLDPDSLEVVAEIPVGETPEALASNDEELWVGVTGDRTVVRVDTDALALDAEIPVGDLPETIEVGGGFVWVKTALGDWTRYDATAF